MDICRRQQGERTKSPEATSHLIDYVQKPHLVNMYNHIARRWVLDVWIHRTVSIGLRILICTYVSNLEIATHSQNSPKEIETITSYQDVADGRDKPTTTMVRPLKRELNVILHSTE